MTGPTPPPPPPPPPYRNGGPAYDPQAAARRTRKLQIAVTAAIVVVAVILAVVIAVVANNDKDGKKQSASPAAQSSGAQTSAGSASVSDGTIRVGSSDPKVVLTAIEDFQCPVCKQFESTFGPTLAKIRSMPNVAIDYHPIAFLDQMSNGNRYSTRAAAASLCVADASRSDGYAAWLKFHQTLYENQPAEGGHGMSDDQLLQFAEQSGAPSSVAQCITSGKNDAAVADQTDSILQSGIQGTPTVKLNGKTVSLSTPEQLLADVQAAAGNNG